VIKGVLIDWGGVLTTPLSDAIAEWLAADRIDVPHYQAVMAEMIAQAYAPDGHADGGSAEAEARRNLVHALERGEVAVAEFERTLAERLRTLDGDRPVAEGMIERMFAAFRPVEPMYDMLRAVRAAGLRTCLVSNSWGAEYPRDGWDELFDGVVISGEVGMRKPEHRIFRHALEVIGLPPEQCVFIDDIEANIVAARELGIAGIHHVDVAATLAELERLLRIPFPPV
jgi:haloacid dehalogenase superfamily, subfamily IA, variant 3 with third motif having DD or ED/haloacid dehalogenase superfamily, subfamily IA, variant 1 with third motif having Dx(3-4)D or Dx(3-4)E